MLFLGGGHFISKKDIAELGEIQNRAAEMAGGLNVPMKESGRGWGLLADKSGGSGRRPESEASKTIGATGKSGTRTLPPSSKILSGS